MGRSTHSDRTTAWAAKHGNPGYRARKIVPSADEINQRELLNKIDDEKKDV